MTSPTADGQEARGLVEVLAHAVWRLDSRGAYVEDSTSWRAFTGQTFTESQGAGWLDAVHPDDRRRVTEHLQMAMEPPYTFGETFRLRTNTDHYHSVVARLAPAHGGQGLEWVGLIIDLDDMSGSAVEHLDLVTNAPTNPDVGSALEIRQLETRLSRALTTREVIKVIVDQSKALVGAFGAMYTERARDASLSVVNQSGMPLDAGASWRRVPEDIGFAGAAALTGGQFVEDDSRVAEGLVFRAVPVWTAGEVSGSLTYVGDPTALADETLIIEVGRILGHALDRAQAFDRESSIAVSLQRGMLPTTLPNIDGAELGVTFRSGSDEADVGGDWFETIRLNDGRLLLAVGDVMGKGLPAASTMNEFRYALRALSVVSSTPERLLQDLASYHSDLSGDKQQILTLLVALYDPATGELRWSSAGHIPPVIVGRSRGTASVEITEDGQGLPLGVGEQWPVGQRRLAEGDALFLVSDGLVEDRQRDLDKGLDQLRQVCGDLPRESAAVLCDRVLNQMVDQEVLADDVTVLCLTLDAEREAARWPLSADPRSVSLSRYHVQAELTRLGADHTAITDTILLLTSELATNAIRHTATEIVVCLERIDRLIRISVWDSDPRVELAPRQLEIDAEHGRGLHLVEMLSMAWGVTPKGVGKDVWFEMELPQ